MACSTRRHARPKAVRIERPTAGLRRRAPRRPATRRGGEARLRASRWAVARKRREHREDAALWRKSRWAAARKRAKPALRATPRARSRAKVPLAAAAECRRRAARRKPTRALSRRLKCAVGGKRKRGSPALRSASARRRAKVIAAAAVECRKRWDAAARRRSRVATQARAPAQRERAPAPRRERTSLRRACRAKHRGRPLPRAPRHPLLASRATAVEWARSAAHRAAAPAATPAASRMATPAATTAAGTAAATPGAEIPAAGTLVAAAAVRARRSVSSETGA